MWDFDWDGTLFLEKAVKFLTKLFENWNQKICGHLLTLILFSRVVHETGQQKHSDMYRVVTEAITCPNWLTLLPRIKREMQNYPNTVSEAFVASNAYVKKRV